MQTQMHQQLFSDSQRLGFAKKLIRGDGHFSNLFERVPREEYGLNQSNQTRYHLKLKPLLLGNDDSNWFINEKFTASMICNSSFHATTKTQPHTFLYSRHRVTERNIKKFCDKFSVILNNKQENTPSTENESGKTYEDYFVTCMEEVLPDIDKKDNLSGYPLA